MNERRQLLESIANTVADYRAGEVAAPNPEHVDTWIRQFDREVRLPLLGEMDHVLKSTYFKRDKVIEFLGNLVRTDKLAGAHPCEFWKSANFLDIQQNGHSQQEMLQIFGESLKAQCKLDIKKCGSCGGPHIYLDDVLFSGGRVGNDLSGWLQQDAPAGGTVHIIVIASHALGEWQSLRRIKEDARTADKKFDFRCWRAITFENRKIHRNSSEVLWPAVIPDDAQLQAYMAEEQRYPFEPRQAGGKLQHDLFSSEQGRQLLEREFLLLGVRIRSWCQNPSRAMRPLGFSAFGLGFGSLIVTFRNCANNCPLALWWGDPDAGADSPLSRWYPLFPRKTYRQDFGFDDISF